MVLLAQYGCRPPPVVHEMTFDSKVIAGRPVAIDRLLVVADVELRYFPEPMFDGFHDAVTNRLAACGVQSSVLYVDPTVLGSDDRVVAELKSSQPNVILVVRAAGADVVGGDRAFSGKMWFDLTLVDARSQAPTWRARSMVDGAVGRWSVSAETGATFATGIVSQLRDDSVLAGCPPRARTWPEIMPPPGCLQERRRALREAASEWDDSRRGAKMRKAPTCDTAAGSQ